MPKRFLGRLLAALACCLCLAPPVLAQGRTLVIGGALRDDNTAVWGRFAQLAGGPGACVAVFTAASGEPDASAAALAAQLARHGLRGLHVRVGPLVTGGDADTLARATRDPAWLGIVQGCRAVYFSGGAQARLMDTLQPGGRPTPLLDAVHALWRAGGVVAGSSAGAAVMSAVAFRDAPEPLAVLQGTLRAGIEWDRGFGFVPAGVVVDQHAVRRGRIGRLLPLMQAQGQALGVAVEEDSAALFDGDRVEVLGAQGVLVADLSAATRDTGLPGFQLAGATLHWLQGGDAYRLSTRSVLPSAARRALPVPPASDGGAREGDGAPFDDILGEGVIVQAMRRALGGGQVGRTAGPAPRFEFRLRADGGTRAWRDGAADGGTLQGVRLDIVPVP